MRALILALLLPACGPAAETPHTPQIDAMNCVTEQVQSSTECDASHTLVIHCGTPEAQPSELCVEAIDGTPRGLIWCCQPVFASTCGDLCE